MIKNFEMEMLSRIIEGGPNVISRILRERGGQKGEKTLWCWLIDGGEGHKPKNTGTL